MNKPTIFFSHSSKDKENLIILKQLLLAKTGNTINVFLSSDGQSIPLGRNWVHKVQESLEDAKIMFSFVSHNALTSHWTFFESGYAYSKKIRVIPVGILGLDLGSLPPPLSLLQGFNITSSDSLNNLIAVINDEFSCTFSENFTKTDYETVFPIQHSINSGFGMFSELIETLKINIEDDALLDNRETMMDKIEASFRDATCTYQRNEHWLRTFGVSIRSVVPGGGTPGIEISLAPELIDVTFPQIDKFLPSIIGSTPKEITFTISFYRNVKGETDKNKITAKLYGKQIVFNEDDRLTYQGLSFALNKGYRIDKYHLNLKSSIRALSEINIVDLVSLLFEGNVLWATISNQFVDYDNIY